MSHHQGQYGRATALATGSASFTADYRLAHFRTPIEWAALSDLTTKARINCILQLGYFKGQQQFFPLKIATVRADVAPCSSRARDYEFVLYCQLLPKGNVY